MRLYESIMQKCMSMPDMKIKKIILGWRYGISILEDGSAGICPSLFWLAEKNAPLTERAGKITTETAHEIVPYMISPYLHEMIMGSCVANAMLMPSGPAGDPLILLDRLAKGTGVALVGYNKSLAETIRSRGFELQIFDAEMSHLPNVRPFWAGYHMLPSADAVIVTTSAFLDRSLIQLASVFEKCRNVIFVAASVPYVPELYAEMSIDWLSCVRVKNPDVAATVISEGGGVAEMGDSVEWVSAPLKDEEEGYLE